jgi:hypothetical protein
MIHWRPWILPCITCTEEVLQPEWLLVHENARQLERALRALIGSRDA